MQNLRSLSPSLDSVRVRIEVGRVGEASYAVGGSVELCVKCCFGSSGFSVSGICFGSSVGLLLWNFLCELAKFLELVL